MAHSGNGRMGHSYCTAKWHLEQFQLCTVHGGGTELNRDKSKMQAVWRDQAHTWLPFFLNRHLDQRHFSEHRGPVFALSEGLSVLLSLQCSSALEKLIKGYKILKGNPRSQYSVGAIQLPIIPAIIPAHSMAVFL